MFASVLLTRKNGVPITQEIPPLEKWQAGIFEFSRAEREGPHSRRLVLRNAMANPDKGVLLELFEPRLAAISDNPIPHIRLRGIEPVKLDDGSEAAVVQEWLVCEMG